MLLVNLPIFISEMENTWKIEVILTVIVHLLHHLIVIYGKKFVNMKGLLGSK